MREKRIFKAGRSGGEPAAVGLNRANASPAFSWLSGFAVSKRRMPPHAGGDGVNSRRAVRRLQHRKINQIRPQRCLLRQVQPQVGFAHRRHRVAAHDRMAVDAEGFALIGGKQMAESRVAFELRRADDQRHVGLRKDAPANLDRLADAADGGAGIEG